MDISSIPETNAFLEATAVAEVPQRSPRMKVDTHSFREIFDAEESLLLRFAYGIVGQRETAEDLVQEAFLRLYKHWQEVQNPQAWLYRSVRNLALNHLRDHRREVKLDGEAETPAQQPVADEVLVRMETVGSLRLLMAEMPEDDRKLLRMKYDNHLSYQDISERTGLSVGNVGYKLHHVLKNLADSLRRMGITSIEG